MHLLRFHYIPCALEFLTTNRKLVFGSGYRSTNTMILINLRMNCKKDLFSRRGLQVRREDTTFGRMFGHWESLWYTPFHKIIRFLHTYHSTRNELPEAEFFSSSQ